MLDLRAFVLRGRSFRDVPLPGARGLVLATGGGVAAITEGRARVSAPSGSAIVFSGRTALALRARSAEVTVFALAAADSHQPTFLVPAAELESDASLESLARLLRDDPRATGMTGHLVEAFILRARELRFATEHPPACSDHAVLRAIAVVERDLARRFTVGELARAVGLSRAAFARRFAAALGEPPERYLTALRLRAAARRLATGGEGLAAIADAIGYGSEFAFSRAFKRHYGVAPGLYRRRWHGAEPTRMAA